MLFRTAYCLCILKSLVHMSELLRKSAKVANSYVKYFESFKNHNIILSFQKWLWGSSHNPIDTIDNISDFKIQQGLRTNQ